MKDSLKTKAELIEEIHLLHAKLGALGGLDSDGNPADVSSISTAMYLDCILRNSTNYAIATTDMDFRITYYNPKAEEFHNNKAEDVIGRTVMEIHTKEKVEPEKFEKAIEAVRSTGEYCYTIEKESPDGMHYFDARITGIYNDAGDLLGFVNIQEDVTERRRDEVEKENMLLDLQRALDEVKLLKGFLPICSTCKKIRDDKGYWNQIETYIRDRSEAEFTHGICPECAEKMIEESRKER